MKNKDFETLWSKSRREADIEPCPLTDDDIKKHIAAAIAEHKEAGHIREAKRKKLYYYIAAAAACVAAIAIGFWKISTDAVPTMPSYDMLQPTQVAQAEVPAKQHTQQLNAETDTTTTATDNEMKNTAVKPTYKHTETIYAEHKGDIEEMSDALYGNTAAVAEQEPQPILLAETETQIEIEQNLVADTAYMIADVGEVYDVLEMYCSTRCSSNEVIVSLDRLMENTDIM